MKINKKTLKPILISLAVLISLSAIALYIWGELSKNTTAKILGIVGGILSPSTLAGFFVKVYINKQHMNNINQRLENVGLTEPEPTKHIKVEGAKQTTYKFGKVTIIEKERRLIVSWQEDYNEQDNLKRALNEYLETKRKEGVD